MAGAARARRQRRADTALDALADASDPATAAVHAVVTTEQQLFQRAASLPDAKTRCRRVAAAGSRAIADFPTVLLAGDWLAEEQVTAASEFARFMRKPEQLAELAKAGFRAEGATPPASDVVSFATGDSAAGRRRRRGAGDHSADA